MRSWLVLALVGVSLAACSDDPFINHDGAVPDQGQPADQQPADLPPVGDGAVIPGDKDTLLLRGTVVTPAKVIQQGEVLTYKDEILCVAASCAGEARAKTATRIDTNGIIYPGLIDSHNHTQYNYLPVWKHSKMFTNHNQWQGASEYSSFMKLHRDLDNTLMCEMIKYGEVRSLVAGTTMIQGTPLRKCADTLIRNADLPYHGLGKDHMRTNVIGAGTIDPSDATKLLSEFASGKTTAYVIHLSEGIDETARKEFDKLESLGLLKPQVVVIHGTALKQAELTKMKQAGMPMIWSPSSNLDLYGATTDMTSVVKIGLTLALSPDWTPSGDPNVLDELQTANKLNTGQLGGLWTPRQLVELVTVNGARVLKMDDKIGTLARGKRADVLVIAGDRKQPYRALLSASLKQVRLVVVRGQALYGDPALMTGLEPNSYCESVQICGTSKSICVKESASSTNKLDQSLGDLVNALNKGYTPGILPLSTCN